MPQSTELSSMFDSLTIDPSGKLRPGFYKMVNYKSKTAAELSARDNKTILGYPVHGGESQLWEFICLGTGYLIRSVASGGYMTIEGFSNGVRLVANSFPVSWAVEMDHNTGTVTIGWPRPDFLVYLSSGDPTPGTTIVLWERHAVDHGRWLLVRHDRPSHVAENSVVVGTSGNKEGFTITTTVTTVTTIAPPSSQ